MNTPIALLLFATLCSPLLWAQHSPSPLTSSRVANRIDLREKANTRLQTAPSVLINAYRMGLLQGHYPNTLDAPLAWEVFAQAFGVKTNALDAKRLHVDCCPRDGGARPGQPGNQTDDLMRYTYGDFQVSMELIEDEQFDAQLGRMVNRIRYIRLVHVDPAGKSLPGNAVIFKYDEAAKWLMQVRVGHNQNDAAELSLYHLLEMRQFTTTRISTRGSTLLNLQQAKQQQDGSLRHEEETGNER